MLPLEGWRVPRLMGRDGWTPTHTKQCSENMKRCMETILDVRNGFEIHHAVKVVSWSHHVLIFWSYPSFRLWIFPILLFKNTLFPIPCKTCPKSLKSFTPLAGVTLPGQRFEWHPLVLGYFLPLKVAGCCAGGFLLVSVHTLNTNHRRKLTMTMSTLERHFSMLMLFPEEKKTAAPQKHLQNPES